MDEDIDLSLKNKPRLYNRLVVLTTLLGSCFIGLFSLVVIVAEDQLEVISLHKWLTSEADQYKLEYAISPETARYPNPYEFDFYTSFGGVPRWLAQYTNIGFYEHQLGPEDKHFLVEQHPSGVGLMYVVFKDNADDYLDTYEETLHWTAALIGLAMTFLAIAFGLYITKRISIHLSTLLNRISLMSPDQPLFSIESKYEELAMIEQTLLESKQRIHDYFKREQEFSRFAAHEIRTPLMVLQGSSELLQQLPLDRLANKAALRVSDASSQISLLTNTFLLLGQETIQEHHYAHVPLEHTIRNQLQIFASQHPDRVFKTQLDLELAPEVYAPPSFVTVLLNNLLKNAYSYAESFLTVNTDAKSMTIGNDITAQPDTESFGYGLVIVNRICERMGWTLQINQQRNAFYVTILFK